jgi:hypothetical protein
MLTRTGLTVREHQLRTVRNFLELQYLWSGPADIPFMPVLQGGSTDDYLSALPELVLRCRRRPHPLPAVLGAILSRDPEMPLHAFGQGGRFETLRAPRLDCRHDWPGPTRSVANRRCPATGTPHAQAAWNTRCAGVPASGPSRPSRQLSLFDAAT